MPNPSPDEKQDSPLKKLTDKEEAVDKSSSPLSQEDSRHRIVDTSMAGFTVAAQRGEVQEHDSFDDRGLRPKMRTMKPPIETRGPRPLHVLDQASHVADGSEFPNKQDDTSSTISSKPPQVPSVASTVARLEKAPFTTYSPGGHHHPQALKNTNSYRRLPTSHHPNFVSLIAARNSKAAAIGASEEQQQQDTMSIEKVLPDQQVRPAKKTKRKRAPQRKSGQSSGRWTNEEHRAFLEGLKEFGREWKKVATRIPTRTSAQIRSHAQKYFAKLQREQDTMHLSADQGLSAAIAEGHMAPPQPLTPSVQKNFERLMADPRAVQREVETTLRALRERYRQLQAQLEQRQQPDQHSPSGGPRKPMLLQPIAPEEVSSVGSRKRPLQDAESNSSSQQQQEHDDQSSVTTNISASVASLGNEELIALHVLGGALPRNESSHSLALNAYKQESPASSQTNNSYNNQKIPSPKDNK